MRRAGRGLAGDALSPDIRFTVKEPVRLVVRDARLGTTYPPLTVVPPVNVRFGAKHGIIPLGRTRYGLTVIVHSDVKGHAEGRLRLELPSGWKSDSCCCCRLC